MMIFQLKSKAGNSKSNQEKDAPFFEVLKATRFAGVMFTGIIN
ncbi:MAG: hypothetical protein ACOC6D_02875 [Atribacterota bacterium]